MKNRAYNNWRKAFQTIFLVGSFLFFTQASSQCKGISNIDIIEKSHILIDHSSFLLIANPTAKKQLDLEQKVSKKAERKALRKYVKKLKKDARKFKQNHHKKNKQPKESNNRIKGILISLGLFLLFIVFLGWLAVNLGNGLWFVV